jgi:hypothetical protein
MQQSSGMVRMTAGAGGDPTQELGLSVVRVTAEQRRATSHHAGKTVRLQIGDGFGQDSDAIGGSD